MQQVTILLERARSCCGTRPEADSSLNRMGDHVYRSSSTGEVWDRVNLSAIEQTPNPLTEWGVIRVPRDQCAPISRRTITALA
jgi:hypothetical protein